MLTSCNSHFGSDTAGVNTTRRYLCEALSFQYRYIPIGLLECLPGKINERAPAFRGRDELGTYTYTCYSTSLLCQLKFNVILTPRPHPVCDMQRRC